MGGLGERDIWEQRPLGKVYAWVRCQISMWAGVGVAFKETKISIQGFLSLFYTLMDTFLFTQKSAGISGIRASMKVFTLVKLPYEAREKNCDVQIIDSVPVSQLPD